MPLRALTQGVRPAAYSAALASAPLNLPDGRRAAYGVRQGRSLRQGQRPLLQRRGALLRSRLSSPVGQASWGVALRLTKLLGWLGATWGGASHVAP